MIRVCRWNGDVSVDELRLGDSFDSSNAAWQIESQDNEGDIDWVDDERDIQVTVIGGTIVAIWCWSWFYAQDGNRNYVGATPAALASDLKLTLKQEYGVTSLLKADDSPVSCVVMDGTIVSVCIENFDLVPE